MGSFMSTPEDQSQPGLPHFIACWVLFFLISMGLGYASVGRYDPRATEGLSDSALYLRLVAGEDVQAREPRFRVLVPYVAKPFYLLAKKFLPPEESSPLALLIANALFSSATVCLLVAVGVRVVGNLAVALLAGTLYLLNFAIANLQLAGLVDASEACLMMAVTATLLSDKWWPLPLWGLIGALAKETFVPLAGVLALVWWYVGHRRRADRLGRLGFVVAMMIVALLTTIMLRLAISGHIFISEVFQPATNSVAGYLSRLFSALLSRNFWYVFIWLLPLGLMRLRRVPRAWAVAATLSAITALMFGAYRDIGGNVARPMFDAIGPLLSLSTAMFLARHSRNSLP
jgi:hypothetical protein